MTELGVFLRGHLLLDEDSGSRHHNTDFFQFLLQELASGGNCVDLVLSEGVDPLSSVCIVLGREQQVLLNDAALTEDDLEGERSSGGLFVDFSDREVVQWLEVLWLQVLFLPHFIDFEVHEARIGHDDEPLLPGGDQFPASFVDGPDLSDQSEVVAEDLLGEAWILGHALCLESLVAHQHLLLVECSCSFHSIC